MTDKEKLLEMLAIADLQYALYTGVSIDTVELTDYYQFDFTKEGKLLPYNVNGNDK